MSAFEDSYLRPADVAKRLALHRSQVYRMIKDGTLPHIRIGRAVRVPAPAFEAYLRSLHALSNAEAIRAPALGEAVERSAAFEAATGRSPLAFIEAWKAGEIADTPEHAELAIDALALRAALQRRSLAA